MVFVKERSYVGSDTDSSAETSEYKMEDPTIRIPFEGKLLKGLGLDDEITVTLKGTVKAMKVGKDDWNNGLELTLKDGSIDSNSKSAEEEQIDDFMEDD